MGYIYGVARAHMIEYGTGEETHAVPTMERVIALLIANLMVVEDGLFVTNNDLAMGDDQKVRDIRGEMVRVMHLRLKRNIYKSNIG